jgi:hypothetical protein
MTDQTDSPRKYQREASSPHDDASLRKRNAHLERELAITRRYLHKVQREQGLELSKFYGMPRFGKLRYRPIILGYAPSAGARSGLPFDDEFGDAMTEVFGLIGYQHLLCNFKVRNVFLYPASDTLHKDRGPEQLARAMANHAAHRLFDGRVVIVVGQDARRAAGIVCEPDYIGPVVAPNVKGAVLVLTIPDIGHPRQWTRERRETLWSCLAFAMAASRLPCAEPIAEAADLQSGRPSKAWASLTPQPWPFVPACERGVDLWIHLIAAGLAAPPNLTRGAWLPGAGGSYILHATGGMAQLSGTSTEGKLTIYEHRGASMRGVFASAGKRGDLRRQAEDFMFGRAGWDFPFRALDERLEAMRA